MTDIADIRFKVKQLRKMYVPNERDAEIRLHLLRCLDVDDVGELLPAPARYSGNEARGVMVIEGSGGGKTTAIKSVLSEMDILALNPETGEPRYLALDVPPYATLKSVGAAILEASGMSGVSDKATAAVVWRAVRHRLALLGITVLWLDEAQDLVLGDSALETEKTLRMLKSLMKGDHPVVPILSGTERLGEVIGYDPQVSRRFTKIRPSDLEFGADEGSILGLIDAYCAEVGLRADLGNDLAARLIHASRRRFGRAVVFILHAIESALMDGEENLTIDHFAVAWVKEESRDPEGNVFLVSDWLSVELDQEAEEYEEGRSRRQKKKLERA
ncbi:TniB family NTP-binding protein [Mameliella alba]|uniref:TniB family NTP-binding protein n=1 Tax=Mameliella alba TaxID=561184 RepID=UPI0012FFC5AB|nr:TniB family NTP-binding protein [Mameliella alba]